jgi:UPF0042 nucleotide-binding protein
MTEGPTLVVVVTGLSGAGKSTAVHALEDLGYFCVDNLPTPVVISTLEALALGDVRRIALCIDIRVRGFLDQASQALDSIPIPEVRNLGVLFLDATDETLLRRFSSTRRPHPLSTTLERGAEHTATAVLDGIRLERELLAPLRARSTVVLDTTRLSVHELRRAIVAHYGPGGVLPRMHTRFVSFGFKYGTPVDADLLLDVRFLQNPHFVDGLRELTGADTRIVRYVLDNSECQEFMKTTVALLEFCLPRFEREGKSYATVAFGCTGGRHRSVVVAERLAEMLRERIGLEIDVVHRDVERLNPEDSISHPGFVGGRPRASGRGGA